MTDYAYTEWQPLLRQFILVFATCLNVIGFASTGSSTAVILPQLRAPEEHIYTDTYIDGLIASIPPVGSLIGVQLVPFLVDRFGRKKCHILNNIPLIIGWIIVANSTSASTIIAARFLQGFSFGFHHPLTPMVLGECSNPIYRGIFLCSVAISINFGTLYHHLLGTFMNWRHLSYIAAIAPLLGSTILIFIPDSPVWLLKKRRSDEALKAYTWFRGVSPPALQEFEDMKNTQDNKKEINDSISREFKLKRHFCSRVIRDFKKPELYKPLLIMGIIFTAYAFAGTYVLTTYAVDIIERMTTSTTSSYTIMNSLDAFRILIALTSSVIVKKFKRRIIYFSSFFITILSLLVLTAYSYFDSVYHFKIDIIPTLALLIYTVGITSGIQTLPYVIFSEIFSTRFKSVGSALISFYMSIMMAFSLMSGNYMLNFWGESVTFGIYAIVATICWIILYFILPETKDKPLHEIEKTFTFKKSTSVDHIDSHTSFI